MNEIIAKTEMITNKEDSIEKIIDKNLGRLIETYNNTQNKKYENQKDGRKIDKMILYVFSIVLILSLLFTFFLIGINNILPVTQVLYPIIVGLISFLSGYFAGIGRARER